MAGYGLWQSRLNRTTDDYFLAGRSLPWIVAMASIVATETSVLTFVSVPGLAYRGDWFFLQLAIGFIFGRILVSIFLLPAYFREGVQSIYEVLGKRFGGLVQKFASGTFLVTRILADGVRFLATAVVVQAITGWSLSLSVLLIGLVTVSYTLLGGIRAVVWLDSFQFLLYLSGAVLSIGFIVQGSEGGLSGLIGDLSAEGKFQIFRFQLENLFTEAYLFPSALIGGILLSLASHGTDFMMVQRVLACRCLKDARKAMVGSGFFVLIQFAVFLFVGSLLYQFFGGTELEKDREFAKFITDHLPIGLKGLLLAGVLSAAMSTLSSSINSLASSTMNDWLKSSNLTTARMVSMFWAAMLIGMAVIFDESDTALVELGLQVASFTYGGLLGLFILSRTKSDLHPFSLILGLFGSLVIVFYLKQIGLAWTWFIGFAVLTNLSLAFTSDLVFKKIFRAKVN